MVHAKEKGYGYWGGERAVMKGDKKDKFWCGWCVNWE